MRVSLLPERRINLFHSYRRHKYPCAHHEPRVSSATSVVVLYSKTLYYYYIYIIYIILFKFFLKKKRNAEETIFYPTMNSEKWSSFLRFADDSTCVTSDRDRGQVRRGWRHRNRFRERWSFRKDRRLPPNRRAVQKQPRFRNEVRPEPRRGWPVRLWLLRAHRVRRAHHDRRRILRSRKQDQLRIRNPLHIKEGNFKGRMDNIILSKSDL